ncbi:MAG: CBS domain-containing protein [Planctomycetota bacterium]|jgi:acetoin utilization protein AcuB
MGTGQVRLIDVIDDMCAGKDVLFRLVRVAEDVMTANVKALTLDDTVEVCFRFVKHNKVRHVPVMDPPATEGQQPYFVGVVSERDLFRQLSPYVGKVGEEDSDRKALRQPLHQIVTRKPMTASPQTPIQDVIATMVDNRFDMVPVLSDGALVGIITAGDILKLFVRLGTIRKLCAGTDKKTRLIDLVSGGPGEAGALLSSVLQTVRDVMTEHVACLQEHDTMTEAMETMKKGVFRHVPVVDKEGKLVGVVSDRDVLHRLSFTNKPRPLHSKGFRGRLFAADAEDPGLKLPLGRIMAKKVVHVSPMCNFYDAAKMLHETRISCLPVVDEEKKVCGIVTVTDVMRALLAAYELSDKSRAGGEPSGNIVAARRS